MRRAVRGAALIAGAASIVLVVLYFRSSPGPSSVTAPSAMPASGEPAPPAPTAKPVAPLKPTPVATTTRRPTSLASFGWGSGPGQLGRRRDPESSAEAPMALAAGRDGTLWILDQVNHRVLRRSRDGTLGSPIALSGETAQDLRASGDGLAVLDRLGAHSLRRYDGNGALIDDRSLESIGVAEAGGVTGLYSDDKGELFVEEALPGKRVLRAASGGDPLPGRPSHDGKQLLTAQIVRGQVGAVTVRGLARDGSERWATTVSVDRPVLSIPLLDSDAEGGVYLGVLHAATAPSSHDLIDERLEVFRLSADGRELARVSVAHPPSGLEVFRELEVASVGIVWWMHAAPDDHGMVVDALQL